MAWTRIQAWCEQVSDFSDDKFRSMHHGNMRPSSKLMSASSSGFSFRYMNVTAVPATIDWRKAGVVTPVKDQGSCAVAATEGIKKLKTGKLMSLSEQELVDRDITREYGGCDGGDMDNAFRYIIRDKGLTTEANYSYMSSLFDIS
ncbi:senescence-specific cysteine protease SAG39-like [Mercurialis annua]|uniref:senescence-specific cysteine protease SAG39-like n=1 Tax=Mercurialis annua TaxID=3986 RepID=UPI0021609A00|nr:senescence-specific cysteine protease SAG39-like [Mercurialis annua]